MDSSEAKASPQSKERGDTVPSTSNPSGRGEDGPKPNKAILKRTAGKTANTKAKRQKKARASRPAQLGYTVQQGEDMLLVISSSTSQYDGSAWTPPKKGNKKRKLAKGKGKASQIKKKTPARTKPKQENDPAANIKEDTNLFVEQDTTDHRWGESLPEEVLINIFQMVVIQDGAVPFLCRVGRVCRLWNAAASSPVLWRKVAIGYCWIAPGKQQQPKTEKKIKDTFDWLAQNRFSQLRDFSLFHWTKNVSYAVEVVAQSSPHLRSLTLSYCTGLAASSFQGLGLHSRSLQSLNLQYSEFQVEGLLEYLENHGRQIKQILFTHGIKNDRLLSAIIYCVVFGTFLDTSLWVMVWNPQPVTGQCWDSVRTRLHYCFLSPHRVSTLGCCPNLEFLEVNTKLDSKDCELPICIQALQTACPKLKTFRMLNVRPLHKTMRNGADSTLGFPLLEELCIATTSFSYMTDKDLWDILFGSTRLRVLDLRGCSRITPSGLATLPCHDLECLFWGQYFSSSVGLSAPKAGIHLVTQKWSRTLQELDIANQLFTAEDLEIAMSHLAQAAEAETLRSLNLSGTRITPPALRSIVGQMTALSYLNLSSCRYLPRGVKRIYRGQEDIRQLLDKLE